MANDFQDRGGNPQPALVNGQREPIVSPNYWRWLMEGKVFEAGFGAESTAADSQASLVATTATFALQAPEANEPIVVPICLKLMCTADGGALSRFQVLFTKSAKECGTKLALTTTRDMLTKHCLYRASPPPKEQAAKAYFGQATTFDITVSALVAAEYVSYHFGHIADALLTTSLVALGEGPSNVQTLRFLKDGVPHLLTQGAAMLVYIYTATSDSTWFPYMQWAELEENDLH